MPRAVLGPEHLEYETLGKGTPMLLIMGLGAQLLLWPDAFCQHLVDAGFAVTRYDNRDIGLSSKASGRADLGRLLAGHLLGRDLGGSLPYRLEDLADDAAGLLDVLGIPSAHIVGASMGGMIAQILALRHPEKVRTLGLIMTTPGGPWIGSWKGLSALLRPRGGTREQIIAGNVQLLETLAGELRADPADLRRLAERAYDRSFHPAGFRRQFAAVLAGHSRREHLARIAVPTVVVHGSADPLVPVAAGKAVAAAVPGASYREIPGMGHSLPPAAWPAVLEALIENARKAD